MYIYRRFCKYQIIAPRVLYAFNWIGWIDLQKMLVVYLTRREKILAFLPSCKHYIPTVPNLQHFLCKKSIDISDCNYSILTLTVCHNTFDIIGLFWKTIFLVMFGASLREYTAVPHKWFWLGKYFLHIKAYSINLVWARKVIKLLRIWRNFFCFCAGPRSVSQRSCLS